MEIKPDNLCPTATDNWDFRYRYSPLGGREQKRLYYSPLGDSLFHDTVLNRDTSFYHPWEYNLLGAAGEQLAVYHGRQTSDTNRTHQQGGRRVYMYAVQYVTNGGEFITRADGVKEIAITDHLGSTRCVVGSDSKKQHFDYKPFGANRYTSTGNKAKNGFTGSEQGLENRYIQLGARTYDPTMGRFLSVDPMFEAYSSLTPYHYCANSPLTNVDPSGMEMVGMLEVDADGVYWLIVYDVTNDGTNTGSSPLMPEDWKYLGKMRLGGGGDSRHTPFGFTPSAPKGSGGGSGKGESGYYIGGDISSEDFMKERFAKEINELNNRCFKFGAALPDNLGQMTSGVRSYNISMNIMQGDKTFFYNESGSIGSDGNWDISINTNIEDKNFLSKVGIGIGFGGIANDIANMSGYKASIGRNNFRFYPSGWGGNQYVKTMKLVRAVGLFLLLTGIFNDALLMTIPNPETGENELSFFKFSLNSTIAIIGFRTGLPGFILSSTYFIIDNFIGWDKVATPAKNPTGVFYGPDGVILIR